MKNSFLRTLPSGWLILVLLATLLTGCGTDYTPIADGMKAIGICLVLYGVVAALADLVKGEQSKPEAPTPKRPRKRASAKEQEGEQ